MTTEEPSSLSFRSIEKVNNCQLLEHNNSEVHQMHCDNSDVQNNGVVLIARLC